MQMLLKKSSVAAKCALMDSIHSDSEGLKIKVSTKYICALCAWSTQLHEFRVMAWLNSCQSMSAMLRMQCRGYNVRLWASRGRVLGILKDRANVVIILRMHWQMSCSVLTIHVGMSFHWYFCFVFTTLRSFLNNWFIFILIFTEINNCQDNDPGQWILWLIFNYPNFE